MPTNNALLSRLGLQYPIIQASMAGTSTPALAAAVSNTGGLGSAWGTSRLKWHASKSASSNS